MKSYTASWEIDTDRIDNDAPVYVEPEQTLPLPFETMRDVVFGNLGTA